MVGETSQSSARGAVREADISLGPLSKVCDLTASTTVPAIRAIGVPSITVNKSALVRWTDHVVLVRRTRMLAHDSSFNVVPNDELYGFVDPKKTIYTQRSGKLARCVANQRDPIWLPVIPPCQAAREKSTGPSGFSESRETTNAHVSKASRT